MLGKYEDFVECLSKIFNGDVFWKSLRYSHSDFELILQRKVFTMGVHIGEGGGGGGGVLLNLNVWILKMFIFSSFSFVLVSALLS